MALSLDTLTFVVDSSQLDEARIKIAKLGDAVGALNKPLQDMARSSAKTNEVIAKSELAAEKARVATKALADTTGKVAEEIDPLTKLVAKLSNQYTDMASGFTKGESSILNQARNMGVFGAELQPIIALLEKIKTLNKDPFDASLGGVRSITQEFEKLQQRANLAAQGIMLTTKQLGEYSKLAAEAAGKVEGMGFDPRSGEGLVKYNKLLADSQNKYLETVASVNKLTQAEKDRNDALKQQEKLLASNKAISDAMIREVAGQVGQKSPELQQMAEFYKKQELAARQLTAAEDDLILREQKLAFVNKELAAGLTTASANALFKYQKDLEALGKSTDEINNRMTTFRTGLVEKQGHSPLAGIANDAKAAREQVDHLSRAIGVQLGDVAVSLAGGMNPFLVLIQQGDQLRFAVQAARDAGQDLDGTMKNALTGIIRSFIDTGKVIGGFFVSSFQTAGKAVFDFGLAAIGASDRYKLLRTQLAMTADAGSFLAATTYRFLGIMPAFIGTVIGLSAVIGVTLVGAYIAATKQADELTKTMILNSGSMGMSASSAIEYASKLGEVTGSTSKVIEVISAMAKEGGFARSEIETITKAAVDMQKYGGVAIEDTVKSFAKMKDEPVKALAELAKQTGLVSVEVLRLVNQLDEQGKKSEAAMLAIKTMAEVTSEQVNRMKRDYSALGLVLIETYDWFGKLFARIKNFVYEPTAIEKARKALQDVGDQIVETEGNLKKVSKLGITPSNTRLDALREEFKLRKQEYEQLIKGRQEEEKKQEIQSEASKMEQRANDLRRSAMSATEKANANILAYQNEIAATEKKIKDDVGYKIAGEALILSLNKSIAKEKETIAKEAKKDNAEQIRESERIKKFGERALEESRKYLAGERAEVDQTTEAWKRYLKLEESDFWTKIPQSIREQIKLNYQLADSEERVREQRKKAQDEFLKNFGEIAKLNSETYRKNSVSIQQAKEEADFIKYQSTLTGVSSEEREKLLAIKKIDLETEKEINDLISKGIPLNATVIQQTRDLGQLRKENIQAMLDLKEFERVSKELGDIMFLALTNRGASAGKKLRDMIKAELMKPISIVINAVVNAMFGDVMKSLASSGGSVSGIMSAGSSLFKSGAGIGQAIGSGLSTIGGMLNSTSIQSFAGGAQYGDLAVNTMQSWAEQGIVEQSSVELAKSGATFAKYANTAADVLGYLNAFNTALKNPYKGAGQAIGTYFGGPIGSYIGGEIGQVVGDMMGYSGGDADAFLVQQAAGTNQAYRSSAQSRFGTVGFVRGNATIMKNGKLISEYGETQGLGAKAELAILGTITALDNTIASTLSESQIKEIATNMSGWYQKSWSVESDTIEKFIASRYETILGTLDSSFTKLKDYQKEGEKLADTAVRLVTNFSTMQNVFKDLGISTEVVTVTFATSLADMLGGIANFSSSMQYFYDNFFSEPEQIANQTRELTEDFDALGKTLPKTKQEFRTLLEGALSSGDKGLAASLLNIMPAFNDFIATTEEASTAMKDLTDSLLEEVNRLRGAILGSSSASSNVQGLTAEFAVLTAQARAGNATAIEKLPEYSKAIEDAVLATATSSTDVLYARAWLANSLSNTSGVLTGIQPQAAVAAGSFTEDVASPVSASMTATGSVAGAGTTAQQDLIAALVAEVQGLRAEVRADVAANSKTSKILERANQDGETLSISGSIDGGTV